MGADDRKDVVLGACLQTPDVGTSDVNGCNVDGKCVIRAS